MAAAGWAQAPAPPAPRLFDKVDAILSELQKITGLRPLKPVQAGFINKQQLGKYLDERIRETIQPEELRAEELALKKFGFAPPDFDLRATTVELLTEQAAAFYDYQKKRLFVLDSAADIMQEVALVHELAHALADQHFNLERFGARARENDDGAMARLAVMEGQATWLMSEYLARRIGMSLRQSPAIVRTMAEQAAASASIFPVFEKAPLYVRETLLFPYREGLLFQQTVLEKEGDAGFKTVFQKPPKSTQQVLHPEKYFSGVEPVAVELPPFAGRGEYRTLLEGTLGELDHSILLRQYAGPETAAALAPLWRGGRYRLLEHRRDGRPVLMHASEWENQEAAAQFFVAYRSVLRGKWKRFDVAEESATTLAGTGDDGEFIVLLEGRRVTSVEGLHSRQEAGRKAALH